MNIAILIPSLTVGGAERVAVSLGNYYSDKGHDVYFFLFPDAKKSFFEVKGRIVRVPFCFPYTCYRDIDNIREVYFAAKKLNKIKQKYKIDVSVSFMEGWNFINAFSKGKEKVIVSSRTVLSERKVENKRYTSVLFDERWVPFFYNRSDYVVGVSQYVCDDLKTNYHIKPKKLIAIPNVSKKRNEKSEIIDWKYGDKVLLSIGRLDPIKQQERAIRAFSYVVNVKKEKDAKLLIIGDGRQKNYLKDVSKSLGLDDSVIFIGESTKVDCFLRKARALVVTSRVEGFPNVIVEAMANGVPIITTDSPGGCSEIIGKEKCCNDMQYCKYGILVPYICGRAPEDSLLEKNEEILGHAMYKILSDKLIYDKYSSASIKRSEDYSEKKVMSKWNKLILGDGDV